MTTPEQKLNLEFQAKTPYCVVIAPEIEVGREMILRAAKKMHKDVIVWNKNEKFYEFQNNTRRFADIKHVIKTSFAKAEHQIGDFLHSANLRHSLYKNRIISPHIEEFFKNDEESFENDELGKKKMKKKTPEQKLLNSPCEDEVLAWMESIICHTIPDICLVIEGDFLLDAETIDSLESSISESTAILLRKTTLPEQDEGDAWIITTQITPVLNCPPDMEYFRKLYVKTLQSFNLPEPPMKIQTAVAEAALCLQSSRVAQRVFAKIIAEKGNLTLNELPMVFQYQGQNQDPQFTNILEHIDVSDAVELGGLDRLKKWIFTRKATLTKEAADYGIRCPRGIILCGPPGCGKSQAAMYIAKHLNLPLVVFNPEQTLAKYVGEGEKLLKNTLNYIDNLGKIVLQIDEIEKILGESKKHDNHESSRRLLGTLLTWLSTRSSEAFIIISSNSLSGIPPEFTRKGRIDQIFYIDLPGKSERAEILALHLRKRNHADCFTGKELDKLASLSKGFSGAELEACVENALLSSFLRDKKLRITDMERAMKDIVPLSTSRFEDVELQRCLAKQMGVSASSDGYENEISMEKQKYTTGEEDKAYV